MITRNSAGLYPWSKDLEASSNVRLREREGFAMLLGWLEKFIAGSGLSPGREACERFWKEQIRAKPREKWQVDQWAAAMRWYVRWLEHRAAKGGEGRRGAQPAGTVAGCGGSGGRETGEVDADPRDLRALGGDVRGVGG